MSLDDRRELCNKMQLEIKDLVIMPSNTNRYYVSVAHIYDFDGREKWLAIQCPTIPAFYVTSDTNSVSDNWYIRTVKIPVDHYKFNFELAEFISESQFLLCAKHKWGYSAELGRVEIAYICIKLHSLFTAVSRGSTVPQPWNCFFTKVEIIHYIIAINLAYAEIYIHMQQMLERKLITSLKF